MGVWFSLRHDFKTFLRCFFSGNVLQNTLNCLIKNISLASMLPCRFDTVINNVYYFYSKKKQF